MRPHTTLMLAIAVLALAGCGGGSKIAVTTTTAGVTTASQTTSTVPSTTLEGNPQTTNVVIDVGKTGVEGGPVAAQIEKGAKTVLLVRSAIGDEVHVHGYDLKADVPANGEVRIPFTASIAGVFEVELENHHLQIATLEVK